MSDLIKDIRFTVAFPRVALIGLPISIILSGYLGHLFGFGLDLDDNDFPFFSLFLWDILFALCWIAIIYLGPKLVPKRIVESALRERAERLERLIDGHLMESTSERAQREEELREAEMALEELPHIQAERLRQFERDLTQVRKAQVRLKYLK